MKVSLEKRQLRALDKDPDLLKLEARLKKQVNFFDILQISEMEIRHSNMLAWLLDANQSHGLGDFVIHRLYTEITGKPGNRINFKNFKIYREWRNIDLLLVYENPRGKDKMVFCIENKINAAESKHQLAKYKGIIEREFKGYQQYYCFLTIDGHESSQPEIWQSLSYEFFMDVIKDALSTFEFSLNSRAESMIEQYLTIIERKVVGMDKETKELVEKIYENHKGALQLIIDNTINDLEAKVHDEIVHWLNDNKPEGLYIDETKTIKSYIRMRSKYLDSIFPQTADEGGAWGNGSKYYYDISCDRKGFVTIKLVFALRALTESEKKIVDHLFEKGNSRGRSTSKDSRTVESFCPRQRFLSEEDGSFIAADILEKVFLQKIPAYEQEIKNGQD